MVSSNNIHVFSTVPSLILVILGDAGEDPTVVTVESVLNDFFYKPRPQFGFSLPEAGVCHSMKFFIVCSPPFSFYKPNKELFWEPANDNSVLTITARTVNSTRAIRF